MTGIYSVPIKSRYAISAGNKKPRAVFSLAGLGNEWAGCDPGIMVFHIKAQATMAVSTRIAYAFHSFGW